MAAITPALSPAAACAARSLQPFQRVIYRRGFLLLTGVVSCKVARLRSRPLAPGGNRHARTSLPVGLWGADRRHRTRHVVSERRQHTGAEARRDSAGLVWQRDRPPRLLHRARLRAELGRD